MIAAVAVVESREVFGLLDERVNDTPISVAKPRRIHLFSTRNYDFDLVELEYDKALRMIHMHVNFFCIGNYVLLRRQCRLGPLIINY